MLLSNKKIVAGKLNFIYCYRSSVKINSVLYFPVNKLVIYTYETQTMSY